MTKIIIQTKTNLTDYYNQTKAHLLGKYHDYPTKLSSDDLKALSRQNQGKSDKAGSKNVDIGKRVV